MTTGNEYLDTLTCLFEIAFIFAIGAVVVKFIDWWGSNHD